MIFLCDRDVVGLFMIIKCVLMESVWVIVIRCLLVMLRFLSMMVGLIFVLI